MWAKSLAGLAFLVVVYLVSWYAIKRANRDAVLDVGGARGDVWLWDEERRRLIEYHLEAAAGATLRQDTEGAARHRGRAAFLGRDAT